MLKNIKYKILVPLTAILVFTLTFATVNAQTKCQPLGDLDCDGSVTSLDISLLVSKIGNIDPLYDLNNSGRVDAGDLSIALHNISNKQTTAPQPTGPISSDDGFGVGSGGGLENGINLTKFNQVKQEVASGVYNRPCTEEEHDPRKWHSLVNVEKKCHYDHQHGDDPNFVNDVFGRPGTWFGSAGQSISYPWQTFIIPAGQSRDYVNNDPAQQENGYKHEGYNWVVRRNQDCPTRQADSSNPFPRAMGACVTDFRLQYHFHGPMDVPVRFHSASIEMRVCLDKNNPSSCGIYRSGGWMDFGQLFTTPANQFSCEHDAQEIFIRVPDETRFGPFERPESRDEIRCHPQITNTNGLPNQTQRLAEWWAHAVTGPGEIRFQLRFYNPFGNVIQSDPAHANLFCSPSDARCRFNQSIVSVFIGYTTHLRGGDVNGTKVTYVNRWGNSGRNCSSASIDCVPVTLENVKMNLDYNRDGRAEEARYFHTDCKTCTKNDYDISPNGQQWITWFYKMNM